MAKQLLKKTLWDWRKASGLSETQLGNAVGSHLNTIRYWEEKPSIIPLAKALAIAKVLGIRVEQIDCEQGRTENEKN